MSGLAVSMLLLFRSWWFLFFFVPLGASSPSPLAVFAAIFVLLFRSPCLRLSLQTRFPFHAKTGFLQRAPLPFENHRSGSCSEPLVNHRFTCAIFLFGKFHCKVSGDASARVPVRGTGVNIVDDISRIFLQKELRLTP